MKLIVALCFTGVAAIAITRSAAAEGFQIEEASIAGIHQAFQDKSLTCHQLVQAYLDRIAAYDHNGPALNAILALNSKALAEADVRDADYARSGPVGPLHCVPLVLKDNFDTADLPTTGGSASLAGAQPQADAFVVAKLRKAGAIFLGKSNMHEFARAGNTVSSLGGQTLNPYDLTRTPGGSSGDTGAAVAANLSIAGTGSDTINSITLSRFGERAGRYSAHEGSPEPSRDHATFGDPRRGGADRTHRGRRRATS
jgi:amidase